MAGIDWDLVREDAMQGLAGAAGGANEVLAGAPIWLLRKLGAGKQIDEKIARYKKAWDTGSTIGLLGSALIPYGGIAKGIGLAGKGAKALRGAEEAGKALTLAKEAGALSDVGRLAEAAKAGETLAKPTQSLLELAGKGSALGAGEQAARGFFKDETPEEVGRDVTSGALFGGLGGAAGGLLSKYAPRLAELGKKATEKATLGLTNARMRQLATAAQKLSGEGAKEGATMRKVSDIRKEITDLIKRKKLWQEGSLEKAAEEQKGIWDTLDKTYERVVGGQKGAEVLKGSLKPEDLQALQAKYDPEIIQEALDKIMKPIENRTGFANIRSKLEDMAKYARSGKETSQEVADAMFDLTKSIRSNLDDAVIKTAEAAGQKIPPNFKREYGLLKPLWKGEIQEEIAPTRFGLGSPTFEKAAAASLLGGGSTLLGGPNEDITEKAKRAALAAALGFGGSKLISAGLRKGVSGLDTLAGIAEKVAPKIAETPGALAGVAGRETANIARAASAAKPETEEEATAAQDGAELGQAESRDDYMGLVMQKLTDYAEANGVSRDSKDFKDFIGYIGANSVGPDGVFDPAAISMILYPDPEERAKFTRALEVSRGLKENLSVALRSPGGIAGIGKNPEIEVQKQVAIDKLASTVGEAAKARGSEAAAKKMLLSILNSRATQKEKRALIQTMMEDYGIDFSTLGRVGLNV